jgi:hypothetical protein
VRLGCVGSGLPGVKNLMGGTKNDRGTKVKRTGKIFFTFHSLIKKEKKIKKKVFFSLHWSL